MDFKKENQVLLLFLMFLIKLSFSDIARIWFDSRASISAFSNSNLHSGQSMVSPISIILLPLHLGQMLNLLSILKGFFDVYLYKKRDTFQLYKGILNTSIK